MGLTTTERAPAIATSTKPRARFPMIIGLGALMIATVSTGSVISVPGNNNLLAVVTLAVAAMTVIGAISASSENRWNRAGVAEPTYEPRLWARRTVPVAWGIFLLVVVVSLDQPGADQNSLQGLCCYVVLVLGAYNVSRLSSVGTEELMRRWFRAASWVIAVLYVGQLLVVAHGPVYLFPRSFSIVGVAILSFISGYWYRLGFATRWVLSLGIIVEVALSGSRTALLVAILIWFMHPLARHGRPSRILTGIAVAITAFVILATQWQPLRDRFIVGDDGIPLGNGIYLNTEGRDALWGHLWDDFLAAPWLGHGAGSAHRLALLRSQGIIDQPHNDYLRLLLDFGIIGFVAFILGMLMLLARMIGQLRQSERARAASAAAAFSLVGLVILMATDNPLVYVNYLAPCAALVGIALAVGQGRQSG